MYLSSKINEEEGRIRVRDFMNVAFYAIKEDEHLRNIREKAMVDEGTRVEVEEGVWVERRNGVVRSWNEYSKN
jgi:hypothetical protein